MTLTKKELAQNLSDQTELSLADAKKFVDLFDTKILSRVKYLYKMKKIIE